MEIRLESGIVIVESEPEQKTASPYRCVVCGKESSHTGALWFWRTGDDFLVDHPKCGHKYIFCRECNAKAPTHCPTCGCEEFYC